jgi:hypothetical protein
MKSSFTRITLSSAATLFFCATAFAQTVTVPASSNTKILILKTQEFDNSHPEYMIDGRNPGLDPDADCEWERDEVEKRLSSLKVSGLAFKTQCIRTSNPMMTDLNANLISTLTDLGMAAPSSYWVSSGTIVTTLVQYLEVDKSRLQALPLQVTMMSTQAFETPAGCLYHAEAIKALGQTVQQFELKLDARCSSQSNQKPKLQLNLELRKI